jgi:hypothetical protein
MIAYTIKDYLQGVRPVFNQLVCLPLTLAGGDGALAQSMLFKG